MKTYILKFTLKSDATFGCGDGLAGLVDVEVQHDKYGFPYLNGRTLKGLLVEECADILASIPEVNRRKWDKAAQGLFGSPGETPSAGAILHIGDAKLPYDLRIAIIEEIEWKTLRPNEVLESLTDIRTQTAIEGGVAKTGSLRRTRVILRGTTFKAQLSFLEEPEKEHKALLSACVKALRRVGTGRNRGKGKLKAELLFEDIDVTDKYLRIFEEEVLSHESTDL